MFLRGCEKFLEVHTEEGYQIKDDTLTTQLLHGTTRYGYDF
jgi:hypothetical protein